MPMSVSEIATGDADEEHAVAAASPAFEAAAARAAARRGLFMALPAYVYLVIFFAVPFAIVVVYSFATRTRTGGISLSGWNLDSYRRLGEQIVRDVLWRSLGLAILTTLICLLVAYPFAYYMTIVGTTARNVMLVMVMGRPTSLMVSATAVAMEWSVSSLRRKRTRK